jgi:hypothetical protein
MADKGGGLGDGRTPDATNFVQANLSGTATAHGGANWSTNTLCQRYTTKTFTYGCNGWESDIGAYQASFSGSISGTTLTVSSTPTYTLAIGDIIAGSGVSTLTHITARGAREPAARALTLSAILRL